MRQCDPIGLAKAVLWEEAKGKLRALVAASGAEHSNPADRDVSGRFMFEIISAAVEDFILEFESLGYHE